MRDLKMTEDFDLYIENGDVVFDETIQSELYMRLFSKKEKYHAFTLARHDWVGHGIALQSGTLELAVRDLAVLEEQVRESLSGIDAEIAVSRNNGKVNIEITVDHKVYHLDYEEVL